MPTFFQSPRSSAKQYSFNNVNTHVRINCTFFFSLCAGFLVSIQFSCYFQLRYRRTPNFCSFFSINEKKKKWNNVAVKFLSLCSNWELIWHSLAAKVHPIALFQTVDAVFSVLINEARCSGHFLVTQFFVGPSRFSSSVVLDGSKSSEYTSSRDFVALHIECLGGESFRTRGVNGDELQLSYE